MALTAEQVTVIRSGLDASAYQAGANVIAAANAKIAQSGAPVVQQTAATTRAIVDSGGAFDRYRKSVDPVYTAIVNLAKAQEAGNRAISSGRADQTTVNDTLAVYATRLKTAVDGTVAHAAGSKAASAALRDYGTQAIQAFSSIATGQPIITTLIQQGHQVVDYSLATGQGFGAIATAARTLYTAIGGLPTLLGVGIAVGLGAVAISAESAAERIGTLRTQLSGVRGDYAAAATAAEAAARQLAAHSPLSTDEARAGINTVYGSPAFQGTQQQAEAIAGSFAKLSTVLGETTPDWKRLADAMNDPAAVMQKLLDQNHLLGLDANLVKQAQNLTDANNKAGAFNLLLGAMTTATAHTTDNLTPLQIAVRLLGQEMAKTDGSGHTLGETIGKFFTDSAAGAVYSLSLLIGKINEARELASKPAANPTPLTPQQMYGGGGATPMTPAQMYGGTTPPTGPQPLPLLPYGGIAGQVLQGSPVTHPVRGFSVTERAAGIMQVLPSTAADYGLDQNEPNSNIQAGLRTINAFTKGNPANVNSGLASYGGYAGDVSAASGYIASVKGADVGTLPKDVSSAIQFWGQRLGYPDWLIALGQQLAVHESQGRQYVPVPGSASSAPPAPAAQAGLTLPGSAQALAGSGVGGLAVPDSGVVNTYADTIAKAEEYAKSLGIISDQQDKLTRQQTALNAAASLAYATGDAAGIVRYGAALQALQGEIYRTVTPQDQLVRSLQEQAKVAGVVTEGDRKIAETLQQLDQLDREHPDTAATSTQRAAALNAVLAQQSGAYRQIANDNKIAIEAQDALTTAYGSGYDAVNRATAANQAFNAAIKLFPVNSLQFKAALVDLTDQFERLSQSQARTKIAQQELNNQDQVALLQAETASLGSNDQARQQMIAHLQAEQELKRAGIPLESELAQKYLGSVDALSQASYQYSHQQQALNDIANSFSSAFDTIGDAITQAFVGGQGAAVNWKNVMTSVVQQVIQQLLKLAVLNPLLNSLFGGSRSTLGDVFGAVGSSASSSGLSLSSIGTQAGGLGLSISKLLGDPTGTAPGLFTQIGQVWNGINPAEVASLAQDAQGIAAGGVGGVASIIHAGGVAGDARLPTRRVDAAVFNDAPRFHQGLNSDEVAAILQRGERVLTTDQTRRLGSVLGDAPNDRSRPATTININGVTDFDSFKRSQNQIATTIGTAITRAQRKVGIRS